MSGRDSILAKIKKCLALSASANEHEAAAALRQARKLMAAHDVTDEEVTAAGAEEYRAKAGARSRPAEWEAALSHVIASAFGNRVIFIDGPGEWAFIGCGAAAEVAGYAFAVLRRQAKKARADYISSKLKRCKAATRTRRADLFCDGWVRSVWALVEEFAGTPEQRACIDAYVGMTYPAITSLSVQNRNEGRALGMRDYDDMAAGVASGRSAKLNRGVAAADRSLGIADSRCPRTMELPL